MPSLAEKGLVILEEILKQVLPLVRLYVLERERERERERESTYMTP